MTKTRDKKKAAAPSKLAMERVRDLGRQAALTDSWMEPCVEDHPIRDYGDFVQAHREGWQETDHFRDEYLETIEEIAAAEANADESIGVFNRYTERPVAVLEHYTYPLLEEFWDAWEEAAKLGEAHEKFFAERDARKNTK